MTIKKANPPINGYDKEKSNAAVIFDILKNLEDTMEECITNSSNDYSDYNFYLYEESELKKYLRNKVISNSPVIVSDLSKLQKDKILGRLFGKNVYINLDAFAMLSMSDTISNALAKQTKFVGTSYKNTYKEFCNDILNQI